MAERIQRRRVKGWRMPAGAVYVGRPSRWGNPYAVGEINGWTGTKITDREEARAVYAAELQAMQAFAPNQFEVLVAEIRRELAGRDLCCWCPLDQPCHADILLDVANADLHG